MMCYMYCHMLGMSSTCTNPALYGFLNKNLQVEIRRTVWDMRKYLGWLTLGLVGNTVKIQTFRDPNKVGLVWGPRLGPRVGQAFIFFSTLP